MLKIRIYSSKEIAEDGTVPYTGGKEHTLLDGANFRLFRDNISLTLESHNRKNPDALLYYDVLQ